MTRLIEAGAIILTLSVLVVLNTKAKDLPTQVSDPVRESSNSVPQTIKLSATTTKPQSATQAEVQTGEPRLSPVSTDQTIPTNARDRLHERQNLIILPPH